MRRAHERIAYIRAVWRRLRRRSVHAHVPRHEAQRVVAARDVAVVFSAYNLDRGVQQLGHSRALPYNHKCEETAVARE